jgi:hypothetical protein
MKNITTILLTTVLISSLCFAQKDTSITKTPDNAGKNITQYYSAKFGFYNPSDGLNNGLLFGVDGITEFNHYNFFLSLAGDLYYKKTFNIFISSPPPDISDQQMIIIPLHLNFGYKLADIPDADTRFYVGAGAGYYLYFFSATTSSNSGGGLLGGGSLINSSDSKSGGGMFGIVFLRAVVGKVFVEPGYYFAHKISDTINGNPYLVNPSGFVITLGVQY